jgi:hypothetical protein
MPHDLPLKHCRIHGDQRNRDVRKVVFAGASPADVIALSATGDRFVTVDPTHP